MGEENLESRVVRLEIKLENIRQELDPLRTIPAQIARLEEKLDGVLKSNNGNDWKGLIEKLVLFLLGAGLSYLMSQVGK